MPSFFRRIRWVMVVITILPVALVSLFFTFYMYGQRSNDAEANLLSRGQDGVKYMASNAELAVFSANSEQLEKFAAQIMSLPDVRHVAYYDSRRDILLEKGNVVSLGVSDLFQCNASGVIQRENLWFFCEEIVAELPVIDDFSSSGQLLSSRIGWIALALDTQSLLKYKASVLIASVSVGLLMVLVGGLLAAKFSFNLARPIHILAKRVQHADGRDASQTMAKMPVEELEVLRVAIEQMMLDSEKSQDILRSQVDDATKELRRVNEDLTQRNMLLENTQQRLEAAAKSKDLFLARVSHELRTPLTTVMGYAGLLSKIAHSDLEKEYVCNITDATRSLLYIIDDILTISKASEGKLVFDRRSHNLDELLNSLINQHALNVSTKGLDLLVNIDREVPHSFVVDDQRLRQVLGNFLSNAIKFTEQGEIALNVNFDSVKNELCFSVRDTGIGIASDTIQHLFQPFTQADESISRTFGGSGLGLAIAKQLANLMQGRIELKSDLGKGTEVKLFLPLDDDALTVADVPRVLPLKILAFDSSAGIRSSWRRTLTQYFSDVSLPARWEKLLESLKSQEFDLVLLGLNSNQLNTEDMVNTVENIRALHRHRIAVVYPLGQLSDALHSLLEEVFPEVDLLQKPLMSNSLLSLFENITPTIDNDNDQEALSGLDVLLVEDQTIIRRFITTLLENYGASVVAYSSAQKALANFDDKSWHIILSDLHMPDVNGEDFYTTLRSRYPQTLAPFYIITADNSAKEHRRLMSLGINGVISKPIEEHDFISTVAQYQELIVNNEIQDKGILAGLLDQSEVLRELKDILKQAGICLAKDDWLGLREASHKIKGLAGVCHLNGVASIVSGLSRSVREQNVLETARYLDELLEFINQQD